MVKMIRRTSYLLLVCCTCCLLNSCFQARQPEAIATNFGSNEVGQAKGFTLQRNGDIIRIAVTDPWDTLKALATYYLVKDPQTPIPNDGKKVVVPIRRMVTTSTTHYEPISLLGELNSIVGICNHERTYNATLKKAYADNKVKGLGDNTHINRETLISLRPEALMVSRYSASDQSLATIERDGHLLLYNQEWQENTLLGRAEWIKFIGAFYNKTELADSIYNAIETKYNQLKALTRQVEKKPKIMSGCGYQGTWYVPGGQSYMADLYRDAGADYFYTADKNAGSLPLSLETILTNFQNAEYWFGAQESTLAEVEAAEPRITRLSSFKKGTIYNFNRRSGANGSSDFWEGAISHPDLLLSDVIAVLHPEILPNHEFVYIQKLKQ